MKQLTPYLIATAIVYFCFSFTTWQWNPEQWEESKRFGFILLWLGALALVYPLNEIIKINKQD
jgi:hypothetical protein